MEIILFFLFGIFFGSFANVVSLRLHSGKGGILGGHSECPKCGHRLSWWENLPLLSWILLRGKCHQCRTCISWQYPVTELFFGFLFAGTFFFVGRENPLLLGIDIFLVFALGIVTLSDLRYMDIPDEVSVPAILIAVISAGFSITVSPSSALWGAITVYGFFAVQILLPASIAAIRQKKKKIAFDAFLSVFLFPAWILFAIGGFGKWFEKKVESGSIEEFPSWIGGGDLRLAILMGVLLGPSVGILSVFLGYAVGAILITPLLIFGKKSLGAMIPLGPFLAFGAVMGIWFGEALLEKYLNLLGF